MIAISKVLILILLINCNTNNNRFPYEYLLNSLIDISPKAIFSYPGRYEEYKKKREVIDRILEILDSTKNNLYIYAYSFNNPEILNSLKKLKEKGVSIIVILDKDKDYSEFYGLKIPYRIWQKSGLHHLKIIVSDNKRLFLGTGNFSKYGVTHDWNGYLDIPISPSFSEKFKSNLEEKKADVVLEENGIQYLFSPENGLLIQDIILEEMDLAKNSIKILAFDHYDEVFTSVLKKKSSEGVSIEFIYNDPIDPEAYYLNNELYGLFSKIYRDGNTDTVDNGEGFPEGGLLHHKTIIVDDSILLSGSFNFSFNARDKNREIFFKTKDFQLVNSFVKEFDRIKFSSYPLTIEKRNLNKNKIVPSLHLDTEKVCFSQKIGSSTIEVGSGIFKSILRYTRLKPTECFSFSSYEQISSGISSFVSESTLASPFLWNEFLIQKRIGNDFITSQGSNDFPFSSNEILLLETIDFTLPNKIFITLKRKFESTSGDVYFYSPSFEVQKGKYINRNNGLEIDFNVSIKEQKKGAFFFKDKNNIYFGCFINQSEKSDTLNYLLKKIKFKSRKDLDEKCLEVK